MLKACCISTRSITRYALSNSKPSNHTLGSELTHLIRTQKYIEAPQWSNSRPSTITISYASKRQVSSDNEASQDILAAGTALRNIGWLSFWSQLTLNVVAAIILVFSTGATSAGAGIALSPLDFCTLGGVICGIISTFLAWLNIRTGRRIGAGLIAPQNIQLSRIAGTILASSNLNLLGLGASIIGLQATIGSLVGKTLSSATGSYLNPRAAAPPVAFDVFSVQACANNIMAHFAALVFSQWLLRILNKYIRKEEEGVYT
jgi:hypothetical protein